MWNNLKGLAAARRQFTNGDLSVERHGDTIWDAMTYRERFRKADIVADIIESHGYKARTAELYVSAFFAYCRAAPEEFSGPASRLVKTGHIYSLANNPER